ncbi:MAG: peptide deformylase [Candidatus Izemoplasmatales bacterium]
MKDIRQEGDPILRRRAEEVAMPLSQADYAILKSMMNYILNSQNDALAAEMDLRPAVGLAAPQIGVSKRMFCMNAFDEKGEVLHRYAFVNPKILSSSEEQCYVPGGEGCLSVDEEKNGLVPRAKRIKARAILVDLETARVDEVIVKLSGFPAVVFQHEYDHLLGILFIDKKKAELPGIKPIEFVHEEEAQAE